MFCCATLIAFGAFQLIIIDIIMRAKQTKDAQVCFVVNYIDTD